MVEETSHALAYCIVQGWWQYILDYLCLARVVPQTCQIMFKIVNSPMLLLLQ
jgi:hypothetical protein